jgi:hypothetical protein
MGEEDQGDIGTCFLVDVEAGVSEFAGDRDAFPSLSFQLRAPDDSVMGCVEREDDAVRGGDDDAWRDHRASAVVRFARVAQRVVAQRGNPGSAVNRDRFAADDRCCRCRSS